MFKNIDVSKYSSISDNSKDVKKNGIFVAIKGINYDGHDYINEAIQNGAGLIVAEKEVEVPNNVVLIKVDDSREALGEISSLWFDKPSKKLKVIGVTGTKGKTTTAYIIHHILSSLGKKTGLVTSIVAKIGNKEVDTGFHVTSPDVISLHRFLADMVKAGCEYAVVEVSSHGIDQKRIAGVNFEVGVLTNIAPEHLDYHKTLKEYKRVKMSFINSCKYKVIAPKETDLKILPGRFNNLNVDAALSALKLLDIDRSKALKTLDTFNLPEGRLEEIKNDNGFRIFVDFAHTPDSLEAALTYLRAQTKGNLISVFGCAAERDVKKRRKMGKISGQLADLSIFTVEDSRFENISDIFRLMKKDAENYVCIPERGEAIAYALDKAQKGDVVGIFGKGHEKSLAYKGFEHPWSDQEAVINYLKRNKDISAIILAAGKGTRMKSRKPKVIHEICGRPMIAYTLENLRKAGVGEIVVVVSFRKNLVINKITGEVKIAVQKNPKGGTADAALSGYKMIGDNAKTLIVINGDDSAFYRPETIKDIVDIHHERGRVLTFVSLIKENPTGLGRVIRGKNGLITKIVEEKDATPDEHKIKEVNDGLYVFDRKWFADNINKVKLSPQGEFYLVDLVKIAIDEGSRMATYTLPNDDEWQGINTPEQLEEANNKMSVKLNEKI
jgi:UDP-N-acetylmuramoyl-L-alanyl-D-glutamate--2,6-diaminopimelate ligase